MHDVQKFLNLNLRSWVTLVGGNLYGGYFSRSPYFDF